PEPYYEWEGQIVVDLPGARALFTTVAWGDMRQTAQAISRRLELDLALPTQVHGTAVAVAGGASAGEPADAVVTRERGRAAAVLTADCVPILISGGDAVAAVHAGWKGLRAGVIDNSVRVLRDQMANHEAALTAVIGPAAGACCYEVGEELHDAFARRGQDFRQGANLDLHAIARAQLAHAGVGTIIDGGICTICSDPNLLFSHRRDHGTSGRQGAIVWLT
ncbi:MAG TPA: peptidoglycan editing factor PgeF, partial [Solirubrobacteraceae bacterium]|nr:peptidoglycan editing factor PgeF [Solirubrobacteraceae bacterium]